MLPNRFSQMLSRTGSGMGVVGATVSEFDRFVAAGFPVDDPHQHAVAVAWVIDSIAEQLLLVHHRIHGWSCPGGHLEPGEIPVGAATRELAEETGVTATPLSMDPIVVVRQIGCPRRPNDDQIVHWVFGYRFEVSCTQVVHTEPNQPAQWFPFDALPHHRPSDIDEVLSHLELT